MWNKPKGSYPQKDCIYIFDTKNRSEPDFKTGFQMSGGSPPGINYKKNLKVRGPTKQQILIK